MDDAITPPLRSTGRGGGADDARAPTRLSPEEVRGVAGGTGPAVSATELGARMRPALGFPPVPPMVSNRYATHRAEIAEILPTQLQRPLEIVRKCCTLWRSRHRCQDVVPTHREGFLEARLSFAKKNWQI